MLFPGEIVVNDNTKKFCLICFINCATFYLYILSLFLYTPSSKNEVMSFSILSQSIFIFNHSDKYFSSSFTRAGLVLARSLIQTRNNNGRNVEHRGISSLSCFRRCCGVCQHIKLDCFVQLYLRTNPNIKSIYHKNRITLIKLLQCSSRASSSLNLFG